MNNNLKESSSISHKISEKIKTSQVKMRPRIYFISRAVLIALIALFVVCFVLCLASFIFFSLRTSGVWFLPGFGWPAMGIFFSSLPWLLILITIILIIILEIFAKRFSFAYRRPILYSVLGIIILAVLGGFLVMKTHLHSDLFWQARQGKLPMAGEFYQGFGAPKLDNVHHGIISDITESGFIIETPRGEILEIVATPTDVFLPGEELEKGDKVVILGKRDDDRVEAIAIQKIDDQLDVFQRRPFMPMPMPMHWDR